jgi:uncharacterized protein YyaL (SSP411 family)
MYAGGLKDMKNTKDKSQLNILNELIKWFLDSQIFNGEAYVAYYSGSKRGPIYPEITAYAISLSCILFKRTGEQKFLERAEKIATYMMSVDRQGGIPNLVDNLLYTFDTGIFISAMFDLYEITRNDAYLEQACKSINWLHSLWDGRQFLPTNKSPKKSEWYQTRSVHLVKLVIPLLKAAEYLGDEKYKSTAMLLLEEYKQLQEKDGRFRLNKDTSVTIVHPHCYATEGYLYAYYKTGKSDLLEIAYKAGNWLAKMQNSDGSLYRVYTQGSGETCVPLEKVKTSDATAQATRIWKLLGLNESNNIERSYAYLNSELDGGLHLFRNESLLRKLFLGRRPIYSWPTFFYIHSLMLPFGEMKYCKEIF